jgi:S1-C subfamily serine protease
MTMRGPRGMQGNVERWILVGLIAGIALWYFLPQLRQRAQPVSAPASQTVLTGQPVSVTPPAPIPVVTARGDLAEDEKSTIAIFEHSKGSVVYISTREKVVDFWTRNVMTVPRGTGSGFIWDAQGHVVTNLHVIAGASDANVRLNDGRDYSAELVGASASHDLAVLRIKVPGNLPAPLPVGVSHTLRVGQKAFAIGNPFGLDWTLTTGIVSALDRSLNSEDGTLIEHLIQTDAAINPGNSGGPLLDSAGRLIGITTAIYSPSGANAGVGFAVPADTVNRIVPLLIRDHRYVQPDIGARLDEQSNGEITRQLNVPGVVVLQVDPGSTAEAAGLQGVKVSRDEMLRTRIFPGDIIQSVNGRPVASVGELRARFDDHSVGEKVKLKVWREGKSRDVSVKLQAGH